MTSLSLQIAIDGMTCSSCSNTVERAVEALGGGGGAGGPGRCEVSCSVSLATNMATVDILNILPEESGSSLGLTRTSSPVTAAEVIDAIECVGFGALLLDSKMMVTSPAITNQNGASKSSYSYPHTTTSSVPSSSSAISSGHVNMHTLWIVTASLEGMTCSSCSNTIQTLLNGLVGVSDATVSLTTNSGTFTIDENVTDFATIKNEIEDIGFGCEFTSKHHTISNHSNGNRLHETQTSSSSSQTSIRESSSASANTVETFQYIITVSSLEETKKKMLLNAELVNRFISQLASENGVAEVSFIEKNGSLKLTPVVSSAFHYLRLTCDLARFGPRDALRLARNFGLRLETGLLGGFSLATRLAKQYEDETRAHRNTAILSWLFTVPILVITMILPAFPTAEAFLNLSIFPGFNIDACLLVVLSFPVQWIVGMKFHSKAIKSVINKSSTLGMDFLISTGTCAAYLYSFMGLIGDLYNGASNNADVEYFETSAVLISVVVLGKYLETFAKGQTASAIHKLTSYRAKRARLLVGAKVYKQAWTGPHAKPTHVLPLDMKLSKMRDIGLFAPYLCKDEGEVDSEVLAQDTADSTGHHVTANNSGRNDQIIMSIFSYFGNLIQQFSRSNVGYSMLPTEPSEHLSRDDEGSISNSGSKSISSGGIISEDEEDEEVHVDAVWLQQLDCLRLVAGENIPADGVLVSGFASIDEAMMTGESLPVSRGAGEKVFAGTTVVDGSAILLVLACGDGSTLGKIVSTVQSAQASKPPIQELADKIAKSFVPVVSFLSVLTFCIWMAAYFLGVVPKHWYTPSRMDESMEGVKEDMGDGMFQAHSLAVQCQGNAYLMSFLFALSVWVSACPCAFGLATPTVILVATGIAASYGILIRRGASVQYSAEIDSVAFDKTGTLTLGKPEVSDFYFIDGKGVTWRVPLSDQMLLKRMLGQCHIGAIGSGDFSLIDLGFILKCLDKAEAQSSHPLAIGIKEYTKAMLRSCVEVGRGDSRGLRGEASDVDASLDAPLSSILANIFSDDDEGTMSVEAGQGLRISFRLSKEQLLKHASKSSIFMSVLNDSRDDFSSSLSSFICLSVLVGSAHLLLNNGISLPPSSSTVARGLREGGKVTIFMAMNKHVVAVAAVADSIRPEAPAIVSELQENMGIKCYMITGDERVTALAIASALGIPSHRVFAKASPEDKENFIKALQFHYSNGGSANTSRQLDEEVEVEISKSGKVMFIGDGTNDAMAMAAADVSIAMSGGTDIAIESGDVVFCKGTNTLESLPILLDLCRKSMKRILINYFWALGYNALLIPMAAGAFYPAYQFSLQPMLAGTAMAASSVSIVVNSLLLKLFEPSVKLEASPRSRPDRQRGSTSSSSSLSSSSSSSTPSSTANQCNCPASSAPHITRNVSLLDKISFYLNNCSKVAGPNDDPYSYDVELAKFSGRQGLAPAVDDSASVLSILSKYGRGLERFKVYNSNSDVSHELSVSSPPSLSILSSSKLSSSPSSVTSNLSPSGGGCMCGAGNCKCGPSCLCGVECVRD